jgi:hypothetical protein
MSQPDKWDEIAKIVFRDLEVDYSAAACWPYDIIAAALRDAEKAGMEKAAVSVRAACGACEGTGHAGDDAECEYCGRPMAAIRAVMDKPTDP